MKKIDYTKLTEKELNKVLRDLKIQSMQSHTTLVEGVKKKYSSKNIRKEIARILTEQRGRK